MEQQAKRPLVQYALGLAKRGLYVFPITPGEKAPPLISAWQQKATTSPDLIKAWWNDYPAANIGCHVGASGHVVLDIDVKNDVDGFATLRDIELSHGFNLPTTGWNVETPSGGIHIWYKLPPGVKARNSVGKLGDGVDVRSLNGYVLMPPSKLIAKEIPYRWIPPLNSRPATGS